jgi:Arc/MetJ-type ribon-helix-helix transcriptional regulator
MKISVSVSDDDLAYLDAQTEAGLFASRSAVVHAGIRALRHVESADAYTAAWDEWEAGDGSAWERTAGDGITG